MGANKEIIKRLSKLFWKIIMPGYCFHSISTFKIQ
jgi:hypothetical protein